MVKIGMRAALALLAPNNSESPAEISDILQAVEEYVGIPVALAKKARGKHHLSGFAAMVPESLGGPLIVLIRPSDHSLTYQQHVIFHELWHVLCGDQCRLGELATLNGWQARAVRRQEAACERFAVRLTVRLSRQTRRARQTTTQALMADAFGFGAY